MKSKLRHVETLGVLVLVIATAAAVPLPTNLCKKATMGEVPLAMRGSKT